MKPMSLTEFIMDRYKNCKYPPIKLPITLVRWIGVKNIFDEDIEDYKRYLQRIEELQTTAKYAL